MALAKTKKKKLRKKLFSDQGLERKRIRRESFSANQIINFKKLLLHDAEIFNKNPALIIGVDEVGRGCLAGPVCTAAYSCSSFYINPQELLEEVSRSRQLVSNELLNINIRDAYYSETLINDNNVESELETVEELSALLNLEDSKKVPKEKREKLCDSLLNIPCFQADSHIFHSINFESATDIDKNGIVHSIWVSMSKNIDEIIAQYINLYNKDPERIIVLVDGPKTIPELTKRLSNNSLDSILFQVPIIKGDSKSALIAAASNLAKLERDKHMEKLSYQSQYSKFSWTRNVGYGTKKHLEAIMEYGLSPEHRKSFLGKYIGK